VRKNDGRYQARCDTAPCDRNYLSYFDTPEGAAQAYLQHYEKKHLKGRKRNRAEHPRTPDVHDGKYGKKA
jgi:hypothetical protein